MNEQKQHRMYAWTSKIVSNGLLTIASTLLAFVFTEGLLRYYWNPIPSLVETSQVQGLILPSYPDFFAFLPYAQTQVVSRTCEFSNSYTINNLEMRDRPRSLKKVDNQMRFLFIGDSFTEGVGVEEDETYPRQMELLSENKIECLNGGIRGTSPSHAYFRIQKFIQMGLEIDGIVCQFFSNDFKDDQKFEKQFQLEVTDHTLYREAFYKTAGGMKTRLLGPLSYPVYHSRWFSLLRPLWEEQTPVQAYERTFPEDQAKQVQRIFRDARVELEWIDAGQDTIRLRFPLNSVHALSSSGVDQLGNLFREENIGAFHPDVINMVQDPPEEKYSERVHALFRYLDCIMHLCERNDLPLWVYYAPCQSIESNRKGRYFASWCSSRNIPFVCPIQEMKNEMELTSFALFYPFDGHMTAQGHKIVAQSIWQHLQVYYQL